MPQKCSSVTLPLSTVDKHDSDEVAGLLLMNPLGLAFSAWAMRGLSLEQQIAIVQRAGYIGICLVSDPQLGELDATRTSAAERRELRHRWRAQVWP